MTHRGAVPRARRSSKRMACKATVMLALMSLVSCASQSSPRSAAPRGPIGDPVIAAAGDIACASDLATPRSCQQQATSDLLVSTRLSAVLPIGDLQYEKGRLSNYVHFYGPSWGRVKSITRPVPGDHDYSGFDAPGYFDYFGAQAGPPAKGYYSYDLGAWHLVALNGQCQVVGGCGHGSAQERWLAADLSAHRSKCVLAYWDAPRFSTGEERDHTQYDAFWRDLYAAGADVVLNADEHHYERFAPQDPDRRATPSGIREFVVGTGGKNHEPFGATPDLNSEVRNAGVFGVLLMTLHASTYEWRFQPIAGQAFAEQGRGDCH